MELQRSSDRGKPHCTRDYLQYQMVTRKLYPNFYKYIFRTGKPNFDPTLCIFIETLILFWHLNIAGKDHIPRH